MDEGWIDGCMDGWIYDRWMNNEIYGWIDK